MAAASSLGGTRRLGDFDWEVSLEPGYPVVEFTANSTNQEVVFAYNYTGTLSPQKYMHFQLYEVDCLTPADPAALTVDQPLRIEHTPQNPQQPTISSLVDINLSTITDSVHYNQTNATNAVIDFCMRVDYILDVNNALTLTPSQIDVSNGESYNFHETQLTIRVDLTAGFSITGVDLVRDDALDETAFTALDYPVRAYLCDDLNSDLTDNFKGYKQGESLQFCVELDDFFVDETTGERIPQTRTDAYVTDILEARVIQFRDTIDENGRPATRNETAIPILDRAPADGITRIACGRQINGICNVRTVLAAKFFQANVDPTDLTYPPLIVEGEAIIAFGTVGQGRRHLRRVPIIFDSGAPSHRELENDNASPFRVKATLIADPSGAYVSSQQDASRRGGGGGGLSAGMIAIIVVATVLPVVTVAAVVAYVVVAQPAFATNLFHGFKTPGAVSSSSPTPPPETTSPPESSTGNTPTLDTNGTAMSEEQTVDTGNEALTGQEATTVETKPSEPPTPTEETPSQPAMDQAPQA